jgi:hypothetical protein
MPCCSVRNNTENLEKLNLMLVAVDCSNSYVIFFLFGCVRAMRSLKLTSLNYIYIFSESEALQDSKFKQPPRKSHVHPLHECQALQHKSNPFWKNKQEFA